MVDDTRRVGRVLRRPRPLPDAVTRGYWTTLPGGPLSLQRCTSCAGFQHPPLPGCRSCGSERLVWEGVAGTGSIYSFTVCERSFNEAFACSGPYVLVSVVPDAAPSVRIFSEIAGDDEVRIAEVRIGSAVQARRIDLGEGLTAPVFDLVGGLG